LAHLLTSVYQLLPIEFAILKVLPCKVHSIAVAAPVLSMYACKGAAFLTVSSRRNSFARSALSFSNGGAASRRLEKASSTITSSSHGMNTIDLNPSSMAWLFRKKKPSSDSCTSCTKTHSLLRWTLPTHPVPGTNLVMALMSV